MWARSRIDCMCRALDDISIYIGGITCLRRGLRADKSWMGLFYSRWIVQCKKQHSKGQTASSWLAISLSVAKLTIYHVTVFLHAKNCSVHKYHADESVNLQVKNRLFVAMKEGKEVAHQHSETSLFQGWKIVGYHEELMESVLVRFQNLVWTHTLNQFLKGPFSAKSCNIAKNRKNYLVAERHFLRWLDQIHVTISESWILKTVKV